MKILNARAPHRALLPLLLILLAYAGAGLAGAQGTKSDTKAKSPAASDAKAKSPKGSDTKAMPSTTAKKASTKSSVGAGKKAPARPAEKSAKAIERVPLAQVAPYRRVLWVTRWDFRRPQDIERVFYRAAQARFSDVMFQIRGEGTVFYKSSVEPWAWELSGQGVPGTGANPGWDPLAKAVAEGKKYGMKVHAYMNVMPGWSQKSLAPADSRQLFSVHRSWFMMSADGVTMDPRRMQSGFSYACVDPALPDVRRHLASIAREIAQNYAVAGIHLDYVRYPEEAGDYSYNPKAVEAFREKHGVSPGARPDLWMRFKRDQITAVVRAISDAARAGRPGIEITAAIIADPVKRRDRACQDAERWVREGLLDAVLPMAYTGEMAKYREFCRAYQGDSWKGKVWMGIWAQTDRNGNLLPQVRQTINEGFSGVAVFSYNDLFPGHTVPRRAVSLYEIFAGESG